MEYSKNECILKIDNVSLTLDSKIILQNVNAEIKNIVRPGMTQGQVVGFLGPSGVGKTKLFEIMAGLLKPTSGNVFVGEAQKPVAPGRMGVVQQNYPLFHHRTVMGNLEIAAKKTISDSQKRKDKIFEMLDRFHLRQHANMYPAQLSGGQKQRIAIAQQLLCSDNFLLMDEPFSGLDINMVDEVSEMICEISNAHEHNTIIIVSHDIVSTAAISDTLWIMGRDRDAQNNIIPGAKIKHTFDLIERGLAWQPDIKKIPAFNELINEVRDLFLYL
ncbi:ATP-binding cassette domain-containing protein [Cytophagaceae bacterium YF14B1]|uniref:ATP-binding cassette domain-containing protein n=1 Tax=Xanthocytophaga flava TaxID=3048013 RepID=A0AAE3QJ65_9BACT|nr:ATP-binding cassette domain-containing protein [Xanthocytophaga flavus]MDJ1480312.1 ATP-binding cassette domain-containing protein [Xanthocytophaga flavus]